jgi:hypothetical protein
MDNRILWTDAGGNVHVAIQPPAWKDAEAWKKAVLAKCIPSDATNIKHMLDSDLPADRTFRNAWRHCSENGVRHCMPTARNIQKDRLRARRAERFQETDVMIARGLAESRDTSAAANMAARLRDVTNHPAIEAAQTVEDLVKVWPSVLEEPVPALGGPRISGDADYDTQALEQWAQGLNDKLAAQTQQIAELQARKEAAAAVDMSAIEAKLAALDEKMKAGADMADLQAVRQAVSDLKESTSFLANKVLSQEEGLEWLEKNTAHKDLFLKKDVVQ